MVEIWPRFDLPQAHTSDTTSNTETGLTTSQVLEGLSSVPTHFIFLSPKLPKELMAGWAAPASISSLLNHDVDMRAYSTGQPRAFSYSTWVGARPSASSKDQTTTRWVIPSVHGPDIVPDPAAQDVFAHTFASALQAGSLALVRGHEKQRVGVLHQARKILVPKRACADSGEKQMIGAAVPGDDMMSLRRIMTASPCTNRHLDGQSASVMGSRRLFLGRGHLQPAQHKQQHLVVQHGHAASETFSPFVCAPGLTDTSAVKHRSPLGFRGAQVACRKNDALPEAIIFPHSHDTDASSPEPKDSWLLSSRIDALDREVVDWAKQNVSESQQVKIRPTYPGECLSSAGMSCPVELVFPRRGRKGGSGDDKGRGHEPILITMEVMMGLFHLPLVQASKHLGLSPTAIKSVCRRLGIKKWPFRALSAKSTRRRVRGSVGAELYGKVGDGAGDEEEDDHGDDVDIDSAAEGLSLLRQSGGCC